MSVTVFVCVCVEESVNNNKMLRCHSSECTSSSRLMLRPTQGYVAVGQRDSDGNREGREGREGKCVAGRQSRLERTFECTLGCLCEHSLGIPHIYEHTYYIHMYVLCEDTYVSPATLTPTPAPNYMKL